MPQPSLIRIMLVSLSSLCLLLTSGCATVDQKLSLNYAPAERALTRHDGTVAVARVDSGKPAARNSKGEWIAGAVTNVHGVHQADILTDRALGEWISDALVLELKQAGFAVTVASPLPAATTTGVIISDVTSTFSITRGIASDEINHSLNFGVAIFRNGERVRQFSVASRDRQTFTISASRDDLEKVLVQTLQDAMKQVMPEIVNTTGGR